jgi:UMF1 family MFS transporter
LFGTAAEKAYIAFGLLIGIAFGPVQASSRAYMARSVSEDEAGRYFGIYALAGRATSFLAPFMVATVTALSGIPAPGHGNHRHFLRSWPLCALDHALSPTRQTGKLPT